MPSLSGMQKDQRCRVPLKHNSISLSVFRSPEKDVYDHGWAWVVCAAAFLNLFIIGGVQYSFGVMLIALREEFKENQSNTAWVGSISAFSWFFFSHVTGLLCERLTCRIVTILGGVAMFLGLLLSSFATNLWCLYLTVGLLVGFGTSFTFLPSVLSVGFYFRKKRCLATGLAAAGTNVGAFALSQIQQMLIRSYGWRNAYRALSLISLVIVACGFMFRPLDDEKNKILQQEKQENKKTSSCLDLGTNIKYIIWTAAITIACLGYLIPYYSLVSHSRSLGIPMQESSLLLTYIAVGSGVGKLAFGKLADNTGNIFTTLRIYQLCMLISGISSMLVVLAHNYPCLVAYALLYGLMDGCFIGLMSIGTFECVPARNMSQGFGCLLMMQSLTILIGPPLAGIVEDHFSETKHVFYLAGIPMLVGAVILSLHQFVSDKQVHVERNKFIITVLEEDRFEIISERVTVL